MTGASSITAELSIELPGSPYPGLRPFRNREWPIFFGRETMVEAVIDRLIERQFVLVHGDSGCGKSSLIRAGVFAQLEKQSNHGAPAWRTSDLFPRNAPLANLAAALAKLADRPNEEETLIACRRALNYGDRVDAAIAEVLPDRNGLYRCLLVDQFEEIFAFARTVDHGEARQFMEVLSRLGRSPVPGLHITITMRSEFLGNCAQYRDFADVVNDTQYLLPRMTRAALLRAIQEPARLFGIEVAPQLADRLITDSGGQQDQLPLIQHGLMRLYQQFGAAGTLTLDHYRQAGDLASMISTHADQVREEAVNARGPAEASERRRVLTVVFKALTDANSDGYAISRPQKAGALAEVAGSDVETIQSVLGPFRRDGVSFVTPAGEEPLPPEKLVAISHESLIRCWDWVADRKDGLLAQEFNDGVIWKNLVARAQSYDKDDTDVLPFTDLDERKKWFDGHHAAWSARYGGSWSLVQALFAGSLAARRRRQRRFGYFLAGLVLVFCGAIGLYIYVRDAEEVRRIAYEESLRAVHEQRVNERVQQVQFDIAEEIRRLNRLIDERDRTITELKAHAGAPTVDLLASERVTEITPRPQTQSPQPIEASGIGPKCDGAVWIGSEANPYLRQLRGDALVDPRSVKVGDVYRVKANLKLRSALPSSDYRSAPAIATLAEDSQVKALAPPAAYPRGTEAQYWLPVAAAPQACVVAYIQYAGSKEKAQAFAVGLRQAGYKVPDIDEEKAAGGLAELRYFYEEDRMRARLLATQLPPLNPGTQIKIVSLVAWKATKPAPGTIEVWIDFGR